MPTSGRHYYSHCSCSPRLLHNLKKWGKELSHWPPLAISTAVDPSFASQLIIRHHPWRGQCGSHCCSLCDLQVHAGRPHAGSRQGFPTVRWEQSSVHFKLVALCISKWLLCLLFIQMLEVRGKGRELFLICNQGCYLVCASLLISHSCLIAPEQQRCKPRFKGRGTWSDSLLRCSGIAQIRSQTSKMHQGVVMEYFTSLLFIISMYTVLVLQALHKTRAMVQRSTGRLLRSTAPLQSIAKGIYCTHG
jgi:uncharacterized membrane protein SirB2